MDTAHPPSRSHLFTVRVWLEDLGEGQMEWRGEVHYVASGGMRYFRDGQTLLAFVQAMLPKQGGAGLPER